MRQILYTIAVIIIFALLMTPINADVIPPGVHSIDRCVKISNLDKFPDIVLVGYITGPIIQCENPYLISSDECLTKFYRANDLTVYAIEKEYFDRKGLENIDLESDQNALPYKFDINPDWDYVNIASPLFEEEIYYSIAGFSNNELILYESKKISRYKLGIPDKVETFAKPEISNLRLTVKEAIPDTKENLSDEQEIEEKNVNKSISDEQETVDKSILDTVICFIKRLLGASC